MPDGRVGIAYMLNQFEDGGAERQLLELIKRLDPQRYRPVLYIGSANGVIVDELDRLCAPVRRVGGPGQGKTAIVRLLRDLRSERPLIVHSWMFAANTWGRIAGRVARVPIVITSDRGMDTDQPARYRWIDAVLSPLSDRVIVNALAVGENVHRTRFVPRKKIVNIYNGVDIHLYNEVPTREEARRALGVPPERAVVGMVASVCRRKRWDVFLDAVARLARDRAVYAVCVGDGELRPEMERYAMQLGITESVHFYGLRRDVPLVMAALDVAVLSSDDEGMPNVVMQAMAARRPTVATDAGGTAEIIMDGKTGFVVARGDAEGLARRISEILDNSALATEFAMAGRRRVEQEFTFDACVRNTVAVYEELLAVKCVGSEKYHTVPENGR